MDDGSCEDEELIKDAVSSIYIGEFLQALTAHQPYYGCAAAVETVSPLPDFGLPLI